MESSPPGTHGMEASNKNILKWVGFTAAALGLAFLLYVGTYAWKWDWTGIGPQPALTSGHIRVSIGQTSKTLWDVLQLLGVPLVLVILANLLTRSQKERELEIANEQRRVEQGIARDQRTTEQEIARDQRAVEQRIADERLQEETLNAYLGRMADLLLHESLHESQAEDDVRAVARARTLMTLRRLDARRKGDLLRFLYDTKLVSGDEPIIDLSGADLNGADLSWSLLGGVNLERVNLEEANLQTSYLAEAHLFGAKLTHADLSNVNLSKADLFAADLTRAKLVNANLSHSNPSVDDEGNLVEVDSNRDNLCGADLSHAILMDADLTDADLDNANLTNAEGITEQQMSRVKSRMNMIMPDGTMRTE